MSRSALELASVQLCASQDSAAHDQTPPTCIRRSPVNPYTNVFPLVIVLAVSLLKEALEDHKRHTKDVEVPARTLQYIMYRISKDAAGANSGCCMSHGDSRRPCATQINNSVAQVVKNGVLVPLAWQYVKVGDIVKVQTQQKCQ
jgi:hypothetical protein